MSTKGQPYSEYRLDLGMRIRNREAVDPSEFNKLTPEDRTLFEKVYAEYNRSPHPEQSDTLKVERQNNGIEVVAGAFRSSDSPDEFYYHVTPRRNIPTIMSGGFKPAADRQNMADGFYQDYSRNKVFFCDRNGVSYWEEKIAQHIEHETGRAPILAVLRCLKASISGLTPDPLGTKDSGAQCWFASAVVTPHQPKKAKLLRRVAAPANHILVIVHPGSACGSADFEYGSKSAADAERDGLISEFNSWQDGVIVIDGELSDELPDYPKLDQALKGVLGRAKANGLLSIRKMGDDPAQVQVIKAILTKLKLPKDQSYFEVTGAWAYSEIDGCVTSVYDAIKSMGYRGEISPTALTGTWGPDEEWDEDEDEG